jgi:hypothetical protein
MFAVSRIAVEPAGSPLGSGNETVFFTEDQRLMAGIAT